jgi:hypothetical protein
MREERAGVADSDSVVQSFDEDIVRHVVMFSSGAGSAVAAKLVAEKHGTDHLTLLFADVNGEHGDNYRFLREAAEWVGGELVVLDNDGKTIWQVFRDVKFLGNTRIDPCSRVLKREPMRKWLEDNCDPASTVVYLGFDWTEEHRLERATPYWTPWTVEAPMCWEPVIDKAEGLAWMKRDGIEPPLLTRQGFPHANCGGGCVKAGIKQFKRLLAEFPETYAEWEWNEERIRQELGKDVSILRDRRGGEVKPLTLRSLREQVKADESRTLFEDEDWGGCNCFTPVEPDEDNRESEDAA